MPPSGVAALQVLLELLPERLLGGRLAVLDEGADGLTELVERDRADDSLALRGLVERRNPSSFTSTRRAWFPPLVRAFLVSGCHSDASVQ